VPRTALVSEEAVGELAGGIWGGFAFLGSAIAMTALLTPGGNRRPLDRGGGNRRAPPGR
jgi:hypothetical protein